MKKLKVGQFAALAFYDHCSHTGINRGAVMIECVGKIVAQDKISYVVSPWYYADPGHDADHNNEEFSILKSTIVKIKVLR